ncbi:MAG: hypothetical protein M5R36_01045 [Deltaproteobacteria bacterium]|nr:hypothetical protein [Deltaproteobacteria bacterium]
MRFWHVFVAAILAAVFAAALSCADVGSGGDDDDDAGPGPGDDDDDTGASDDDADDDAGDDDLGPDDVYFGRYVVIAYPDSGVSWYLQDFSEFALFPPGNNLRAQVIERSDPPSSSATASASASKWRATRRRNTRRISGPTRADYSACRRNRTSA